MPDVLRYIHPAQVTFVAGESPTPEKLVNWAEVQRQSFLQLAQAIGNIYNLDRTLNERGEDPHPLLLTNLVRAIGNLEYLNPRWLANFKITRYAQRLNRGETEHALQFWPDVPENFAGDDLLEIVYGTGSNNEPLDSCINLTSGYAKATPEEVLQPGEWTVVGRTLYTAAPAQGNYFIYDGVWRLRDIASSFSVIPHLSQILQAGVGLNVTRVEGSGGTYYTVATPVMLMDYDGNQAHPSLYNQQIPLPKLVRYAANTLIPEGLVHLWDLGSPPSLAQARKVEGAVFYGYGDDYTLVVRNVQLEENDGRYFLVVAAEGLAYAIHVLRQQLGDIIQGNWPIYPEHSRLRGLRFTGYDIGGLPLNWPAFPKSRVKNHDHTMYLHRMGYDAQDVAIWRNAMLGDLMMASLHDHNNYENLVGDSHAVVFGSPEGPRVYYKASANDLMVNNVLISAHDHSGGNLGKRVKVSVTDADPVPDYLQTKLVAGEGVAITPVSREDGGQALRFTATGTGGGADNFTVKVNVDDATAAFLQDKITAGENISITVEDSGGAKRLKISGGGIGTLKTQTFTSNGTFVVPPNVRRLIVIAAGGGGGGGSAAHGNIAGGGGGGSSGGVVRAECIVEPGWNIPVVIGEGGRGHKVATNRDDSGAGRWGGPSSFGHFVIAPGGMPGSGGMPPQTNPNLYNIPRYYGTVYPGPTPPWQVIDLPYNLYYNNYSLDFAHSMVVPGNEILTTLGITGAIDVYVNAYSPMWYLPSETPLEVYPSSSYWLGGYGGMRILRNPPFDPTHPEDGKQGYCASASPPTQEGICLGGALPPSIFINFWEFYLRGIRGGTKGTANPLSSTYLVSTRGGNALTYIKKTIDGKPAILIMHSLKGGGGGASYWGNGGTAGHNNPNYQSSRNGGIAAGGGGGTASTDPLVRCGGNGGNGIVIVAWYE